VRLDFTCSRVAGAVAGVATHTGATRMHKNADRARTSRTELQCLLAIAKMVTCKNCGSYEEDATLLMRRCL
jgi:hypothetical protein